MKARLAFLFFAFCLLVLLIILNKPKKNDEKDIEEDVHHISGLEFQSKDNITLLRRKTGEIEELNMNYYMLCVVASEMPFKFDFEALKAQAVVARTYLYNKIENGLEVGADVCDDYTHCQAFIDLCDLERVWKEEKKYSDDEIILGEEKIKKAILDTDGEIITYDGKIINALFHSSSYMKTEDARAIWNHEDVPYLQSVESVENPYDNSESECRVSFITLKNMLIDKGYFNELSREDIQNIKINEFTDSGRVKNVKLAGSLIDATDLRQIFGLKSTCFAINIEGDEIVFLVRGYGHGVGMSQVGADTLAKQGMSYKDIIHHYYTGVDITKIT